MTVRWKHARWGKAGEGSSDKNEPVQLWLNATGTAEDPGAMCTWPRFLSFPLAELHHCWRSHLRLDHSSTCNALSSYYCSSAQRQERSSAQCLKEPGERPKVEALLPWGKGKAGGFISPRDAESSALWGVCARPEGAVNAPFAGIQSLRVIFNKIFWEMAHLSV